MSTNRHPENPNVTAILELSRAELDQNLEGLARQGIKEVREEALQEVAAKLRTGASLPVIGLDAPRDEAPHADVTEIRELSRAELDQNLEGLARQGIKEVREEALQEAITKLRESVPPASPVMPNASPVPKAMQVPKEEVKTSDKVTQVPKQEAKTSEPKVAEMPKPAAITASTVFAHLNVQHWSAQQRRLATRLIAVAAALVVGTVVLALVKGDGKPTELVHVEQVASAVSIPSATTSIVPSATSPPGTSRANESITTTATVPAMSATVQAHPSATVPLPRKPKTATAVTVEKKNVAPAVTATATPPTATAVPAPTTAKTSDAPHEMKFLNKGSIE